MKRDICIPEYTKEEIENVIQELIKNEVLIPVQGTVYEPQNIGGMITEGTAISVKKTDKTVNGYYICESKLEKLYDMDRMGNNIG